MKKAKSNYLIQSVGRALDVLEAFTSDDASLGVTDLAQKLRLHKNNVFRLLATLETRGYVEQDKETGRYRLGVRTYEAGSMFLHHLDLKRLARPALDSLRGKTGETVYLAISDCGWAVYVEMVESDQPVRVASRLGRRLPAHATAAGKALLASLSREEQKVAIGREPLSIFTPHSIVEPDRLLDYLTRIPALGYAVEDEEFEVGIRGAAAPVLGFEGRLLGAVECSAPAMRLSHERVKTEIALSVQVAAREISSRLGAERVTP